MRKTSAKKKEQGAVVLLGLYQPPELQKCLTFARTHEIALQVTDARENELRHIRCCKSCDSRYRAFQRDLGTDPHHSVHAGIRHVLYGAYGSGKVYFYPWVVNLFTSFKFSDESHAPEGHAWHHTHALAQVVHHAGTLDHQEVEGLFHAAEVALVHAAATYAMSESMDDAWPLLEGLKEGAMAAIHVPHLTDRYARLYAHVAAEGPALVRQLLLLGIHELHDRGGESHHFARTALDHLLETRHAHEVAAACTLITRSAHRAVFVNTIEVERLHERINHIIETVKAALAEPEHHDAMIEAVQNYLYQTFEDTNPRTQVTGLLVMKRAFHDAFEWAHAHRVHEHYIRDFLTVVLRRHRVIPVFACAMLALAAARRFPVAWVESVLATMQPHDLAPFALTAHERHSLAISVFEQYERDGIEPPRFEEDGGVWRVISPTGHAIDTFCEQLAAMANNNPEYAFHLEWASARFESTGHDIPVVSEECAAR